MRLSEKTLELNISAQVSQLVGSKQQRLFWFGLTQRQEARAGFDACIELGGRLLIFQFKASNRVLRSGQRMFLAPHNQLTALRSRSNSFRRSIFYAFPLVGTTFEFKANPDLLSQTWLLDVASLPAISLPVTSKGTPRKNGCHNVYVVPGQIEIHSETVTVEAVRFSQLISEGFAGSDGIYAARKMDFEVFWKECSQEFSHGARGLVLW